MPLPAPSAPTQQAPPAGPWQWCVHTSDVDAQARAQLQWRQQYEQIAPGRFSGLVHHVQLPGVRLVREDGDCALRQRGDLGHQVYGFALPLVQSGPAIFNGQRVEGDAVMAGSDELDLVTPTHFSLIAAVVDAAAGAAVGAAAASLVGLLAARACLRNRSRPLPANSSSSPTCRRLISHGHWQQRPRRSPGALR